jgi:phage terminase large subunit
MADVTVDMEVRGAIREVFRTHQSLIISGPAGTGKTLPTLLWLHLTLLRYPGTRALVVRKVARTLSGTTLMTFREKVAPEALAAGIMDFFSGSQREPVSYRYANGSRIMVGGLDEPTKIMGAEVSVIVIDEAIETTSRDIDMLRTRLRGAPPTAYPHYRMILLTNPGPPAHHLKQSGMRILYSVHKDNPSLYQGGQWTAEGRRYLGELELLSGVQRERLLYGRWAAAEGVVWDAFDPAVHIVDPFEVPPEWPRWVGVDFGYTAPFTALLFAEDGDGRLYLMREWVRSRMLVEDHARVIRERLLAGQPEPRGIITDHDAEDRATLERHLGYGTQAAHKSVSDGLQAVNARLRVQADGRARLYVFRDALLERDPAMDAAGKPCGFAEEVSGYVWARRRGSEDVKEEPLKENDHSCDPTRYVIAERDLVGEPGIRWL